MDNKKMWSKETLLKPKEKTVSVCGKDVIIRQLKAGEVLNDKDVVEKPGEASLEMIKNSLVNPILTIDEVKELPLWFTEALIPGILNFNGMDKEAKLGN